MQDEWVLVFHKKGLQLFTMHSTNEKMRYIVMPPLIGQAHTQNDL